MPAQPSRSSETEATDDPLRAITALVLTYNEELNIGRALEKLSWAHHILAVDSGSTDRTLEILARSPNVDVLRRPFDTFAKQCNFGLSQITTPWVLSMDADYILSDMLIAELRKLDLSGPTAAYSAPFVYMVHGRPLRGTLYPPRAILYRRVAAQYYDEGHGHRVQINGPVQPLRNPIYHDDRKPLSRWFASQQRYAQSEADFLLTARAALKVQDRLRLLLWPAPFLVFFYTLLVKGCLFDGWRGWYYVLQRVVAECMLTLELLDRRLASHPDRQRQSASDRE